MILLKLQQSVRLFFKNELALFVILIKQPVLEKLRCTKRINFYNTWMSLQIKVLSALFIDRSVSFHQLCDAMKNTNPLINCTIPFENLFDSLKTFILFQVKKQILRYQYKIKLFASCQNCRSERLTINFLCPLSSESGT